MQQKYDELISKSYEMPKGNTKVAILEEAVRIADAHLDKQKSFDARMELTDAAVVSGRGEKAILSFAWCLNEYDQNPTRYSEFDILWHYKWIVAQLTSFPEISLDQIQASFDDMRDRFLAAGYNQRVYYKAMMNLAHHLGDQQMKELYYEKWISTPHDYITDCSACELSEQAFMLLSFKRYAEAEQIAQPIFQGHETCRGVPHYTYGYFLLPLLWQKRQAEAAEFYRKSADLIAGQAGFLSAITNQLEYLIVVDLEKAIAQFETYLPQAVASFEPITKFYFYRAATVLFDYLDAHTLQTIQMPEGISAETIKKELTSLAETFNQRNGNQTFTQLITQLQTDIAELKKLV